MSVQNTSNENFKFMTASSVAFMQNKETEGRVCFEASPVEQKERVFEQLWIDRGKPIGDLKYGEHSFRNQYGKTSTNQEKAHAIDTFISAAIEKYRSEESKMTVNGNYSYWTHRDYNRESERVNESIGKNLKAVDKYTPATPKNLNELSSSECIEGGKGIALVLGGAAVIVATAIAIVKNFK